jgi:hypothetical protein
VIGCPLTASPVQTPPEDWIPTTHQALHLRNSESPSKYITRPSPSRAPRNALLPGCRCRRFHTGALLVHPDCPAHSASALGGALDTPPRT